MRARSNAAATVLWAVFVAALQVDGTWQRLGQDVLALAGFACGFALLAYVLDAEVRGALERLSTRALLAVVLACVAVGCTAPRAVGLLVAVPLLAVAGVALTRRVSSNRGWTSRPTSIP